jgi:hypothetical protein
MAGIPKRKVLRERAGWGGADQPALSPRRAARDDAASPYRGRAMRRLMATILCAALAGCAAPAPDAPMAQAAAPERYKVVLVAGDPSIRAFDNATARLAGLLRERAPPAGLVRFSARDDVVAEGAALSTAPAILAAVERLAPGPGEGCLVFATSHGIPRSGLHLPRSPAPPLLSPAALDDALVRGCGDAPTVVVLSGCYSGEYLRGPLGRPNRVVLTAARADRPSFGCGAGNTYTFFDECLLDSLGTALPGATWATAFAATQGCVAGREHGRFRASEPQSWFGPAVTGLKLPWRS